MIAATEARRFGSFGGVLALGLLLGALGLGAAAALCLAVLIPLASACLQACATNPVLMTAARGASALAVAVVGSGLVVGLLAMVGQLRATRRLVSRVESRQGEPPRKLARIALELGPDYRLTYVEDPAIYAFCHGFLRPRVCISSGMVEALSTSELRAVLLHEGYHARQRDPLKVMVSRMVAGALFLLPVAADLRDRYLVEKELAADAQVVDTLSARPLAAALLKICKGTGRRPIADLAAAAVGPFNVVAERIRHLAHPAGGGAPLQGRRITLSLAAVAVVVATTVGSAVAADQSTPAGRSCCAGAGTCAVATAGSQVGR